MPPFVKRNPIVALLRIVDPATGDAITVELFVGVLGVSNYTYAEATATQKIADFTSFADPRARVYRRQSCDAGARSAPQAQ